MDWSFTWKAILIVLAGTILLRIAGRKTISQMTLAETVIMIAIGTLLVQPIAGKDIWTSFFVGAIFVGTLLVMEIIQLKFNFFEKLLTGKSKVINENGTFNEKNLRKLRLTVDQLEMKLRQNSVSRISDVKWATLEPNGQLGFELKQESQPVTKKEFDEFKQTLLGLLSNAQPASPNHNTAESKDIFAEIQNKQQTPPSPHYLQ